MTIRIMLVDDHEMVRRGLALMLQAFDDLELVGEAANGMQAVELCAQIQSDVILMDLVMPQMDGVQAIRLIRKQCPHTQVLVLTSFSEQERVQEALKAGAIGYLLKDTGIDELAQAIRQAYAGKASLSPQAASALISIATQITPRGNLTQREREVLALLAEGLSNPQIAARLQVGEATIKSHVSHLLKKLGAANRAEAVMLALKRHLVEIPDSPPIGG
jgi:two-component system, NarL family, response regulator LiaR